MKKIIALILSIVILCSLSVTAFAAESPAATEKVTFIVRKADATSPAGKVDVEYTLDAGTVVTVKANDAYGVFKDWSIYKVEAAVTGTSVTSNSGLVALSAALNLTTTKKTSDAVAGVDYEIVSGSLTAKELTVKINASVIICGNYDNVKTDPLSASVADDSDSAPKTSDMTALYTVVIMLGAVAFAFGAKKVYSK